MEPLPIFVYGTLKRGELRAKMWPHPPERVDVGTILARMYDLGPYPAIVEGPDQVGGELWHIRPEHLAATIESLDRIECFGQDEVDLYVRRIVDCVTSDGRPQRAYAYFLADEQQLANRMPVTPDEHGICHWRHETL